ncbi:MAG: hypothetical protein JSS75_07085 [Bacteroidetes bacterium]|nr:hypothetical protein [Bacteroidota bacterium]
MDNLSEYLRAEIAICNEALKAESPALTNPSGAEGNAMQDELAIERLTARKQAFVEILERVTSDSTRSG